MTTDELDFDLPPELIAQTPAGRREDSRLLHSRRLDGVVAHRTFSDLPALLRPGDLLVFNDARVIPARFALRKSTGGKIDGLFLAEQAPGTWRVLLRNLGARGSGAVLQFVNNPSTSLRIIEKLDGGEYLAAIEPPVPAAELLAIVGRMPLPPYIKRDRERDARDAMDHERYQTVFARTPGAVAAPTAALHFTPALLDALADRGVERAFITLHVGMGTFKPVSTDTLEAHAMHVESYAIGAEAADALNRARRGGNRILAVGTTSARVLESQPAHEDFRPIQGQTGIFIYPPYRWKHVDALITNFHLPRSTLIALVAALVGLEEQRRLYRIAIENNYRFFSYGDAMLVE